MANVMYAILAIKSLAQALDAFLWRGAPSGLALYCRLLLDHTLTCTKVLFRFAFEGTDPTAPFLFEIQLDM